MLTQNGVTGTSLNNVAESLDGLKCRPPKLVKIELGIARLQNIKLNPK